MSGSSRLRGVILTLVGRGGNRTPGERLPESSHGTIPHAREEKKPAFQSDPGCRAGLCFSYSYEESISKLMCCQMESYIFIDIYQICGRICLISEVLGIGRSEDTRRRLVTVSLRTGLMACQTKPKMGPETRLDTCNTPQFICGNVRTLRS